MLPTSTSRFTLTAPLRHDLCRALVGFALATATQGTIANPTVDGRDLPDVTVYADRLAADHIDPALHTASVTVIEGESVASDVATLADVLRQQPGVQVRQTGGLGSYSTVYLRGSTSQQVNVYLDGVLINEASGGTVDLSQFLLSQIERVEIYRGAVPVQLGMGAIGGAVNIITRKAAAEPYARVQAGYGSFASRKLAGTWSRPIDQGSLLVGLDYLGSDNDFDFINDNQTEFNPADDFSDTRHNADFDQWQGLVSYNRRLSEHYRLDLIAQHLDKRQALPDLRNLPSTTAALDTSLTNLQAKLGFSEATLAADTRAYASRRLETYDDLQGRIGLGREHEETEIRVLGLTSTVALPRDSHRFVLTFDGRHEEAETRDLTGRFLTTEARREQAVVGLLDEWSNTEGDWLLNLGGRLYGISDEAPATSAGGAIETRREQDMEYSLQGGLQTLLDTATTLHASLSRDVRLPQLNERFGNRGFLVGNPDLEPETAINVETGVRLDIGSGTVAAAAFYRRLDQAIVALYDSRGVGRFENVSAARIAGLEFSLAWSLPANLGLTMDSTLQDSENLSDARDQQGRQLAGVYQQSHQIGLTHTLGPFLNGLRFQHESGAYYDNTEALPVADRNLLGWTSQWQHDGLSVEISLDNLTDEATEDFNGFPGPGRRAFLTLSQVL